jgi:hypothetical protein
MKVNSHYKDLLRAFDRHGVRYLIVGAFAVMAYTEPRYTKDFDVWIEPSAENAVRILAALAEFGAPVRNLTPSDFTELSSVYQIGVDPVRIDIIMGIEDLSFAQAWERRAVLDFDGDPAPFLSIDDLIAAKRASGRGQDRLDLQRLKRAQSHPPDLTKPPSVP